MSMDGGKRIRGRETETEFREKRTYYPEIINFHTNHSNNIEFESKKKFSTYIN